ncbi:MAG: hypothetical protein ABJ227_22580, partial [Nitratireductor sp.]
MPMTASRIAPAPFIVRRRDLRKPGDRCGRSSSLQPAAELEERSEESRRAGRRECEIVGGVALVGAGGRRLGPGRP